jgi:hypothetical protein
MASIQSLIGLVVASAATLASGQTRVDVLVYGATPSGIMAATAAAREGVSVLLIEPSHHLGGMVTGGLGATDVGNSRTIGGDTLAFFREIGAHYGEPGPGWRHEPGVARAIFQRRLDAAGVAVKLGERLRELDGVSVENARIVSIATESGHHYTANVFIDATYEGDLMAQAGVSFTVGREAVATYNEERAGIRAPVKFGRPGSAFDDQGLIPYVVEPHGEIGAADDRIMSYTFRLCLTRDPNNRVLFSRPDDYDPRRYELVLLELADKPDAEFGDYVRLNPIPNGKVDANNRPGVIVSTNLPNGSWGWPNGSYAQREAIWREHESYLRGFYWFLQSDPRVSERIRNEAREWGLAADEFTDTGHWPPQIYVRVARRMIGEHVTTGHDLTTQPTKPDSVGMGSYFMDSHRVSRLVLPDGDVATEGGVGGRTTPYQIAYRSLTPKREQSQNLLVPVCLSSSAVALCSIRMEPVYMILGQSAGTAAALASRDGLAVQDVPYDRLESRLREHGQVLELAALEPARPAPPAPPAAAPVPPPDQSQTQGLPGIKGQPEESPDAPGFFPAFDTYGQYRHREWPGKVVSDSDLHAAARAEESDLAVHPGPAEWNEFGGWANGPQLQATGFFRVTQHEGQWWIVDPSGRLFFSAGVNCVRKMDPTPIEGREHFFADYPGEREEFKPFIVTGVSAIKAALGGTKPVSFNFTWANLYRKFGADWEAQADDLAHRRLRSWGFNTIGNWSHEPMYLQRRTPYTVNLPVFAPSVRLTNGSVKDPFDPAFGQAVVAALMAQQGKTNGDPWCVGYFVDNEIPWGAPGSVGMAVMRSPATQAAKVELVNTLRSRYTTIDGLNAAWNTAYASWEALRDSTEVPEKAGDDLGAFHLHFADAYYRTVKQAFVESRTPHLYLGSRIHGRQDALLPIAARYCDIVSVNGYRNDVSAYPVLDRPIIITEFSFGATDRGMFYSGMNNAKTQAGRAERFDAFVDSVLKHPSFVGYHWFQYQDQPASGRTREGENGEYGLVDITDNPARELINATRRAATGLYDRRKTH